MSAQTDVKRRRKNARDHRRLQNIEAYRDKARALIKRLRSHNEACNEEDRYDARSFRRQLRNLRKEFGQVIAGRVAWS